MKIALCGMGSIGRRHANNLVTLGHRPLVYDRDLNACGVALSQAPVWDTALSLDELWQLQPDAVLICTPPGSHNELAAKAVGNKLHVFIEKPLGLSLTGWDSLCAYARLYNLITFVGVNMRFHPGPAQIKKWLDDGAIGEVLSARLYTGSYLPTWRPWQDYHESYSAKVGAILDCGSHEVDLAMWLLGPAKLKAAVSRPATSIGLECDGQAEMILEHESGAVSSVYVSFMEPGHRRGIEIVGTKGIMEWDHQACHMRRSDGSGYINEGHYVPLNAGDAAYVDELRHFLHCVETGEQTVNPISQALKTLELLLEAKRCV